MEKRRDTIFWSVGFSIMQMHRVLLHAGVFFFFVVNLSAQAGSQAKTNSSNVKPLLGRWDLTLKAPDREYPSWIEIQQENGELKAQFVSRWGNERPLPEITIKNGHLRFVSPKAEEDRKEDMVFEGTLKGQILSGTTTGQDGTPWTWTGRRAPSLKRASAPKWGKPIRLFNGKDLTGWKPDKPNPASEWKVENGNLVKPSHGPELINN